MSWVTVTPFVVAANEQVNSLAGAISTLEWDEFDFEFTLIHEADWIRAWVYFPSQFTGDPDETYDAGPPGVRYMFRSEGGQLSLTPGYQVVSNNGYVDESAVYSDYTLGENALIRITRNAAGVFVVYVDGVQLHTANHQEIEVGNGVVHFGNLDSTDYIIQSITMNEAVADNTPPGFSISPAVIAITNSSATLSTTIDELGDIFCVVVLASDTAPSVEEVIAGTGSGGATVVASVSAFDSMLLNENISGLSYPNNYTAYYVALDDEVAANFQDSVTAVNFSTIAPEFSLSSATNSTTQAGDTVTFNIANGTPPYSAAYKGNALVIDSQDDNSVAVVWPDLRTFGDLSANFSTGYSVVLTDNNSDTVAQSITTLPIGQHFQVAGQPWVASSHFYGSTVADGDWAYFVWSDLGNNQQLPANGNVAGLDLPVGTNTLETTIYSGGVWDVATTRDFVVSDESLVNNAPTVDNLIPDQVATEGTPFSFQFAANTFGDLDADTLTYTATMADDSPLISGLVFTAGTRTFNWIPTAGNVGTHSIKVSADDGNGGTVFDVFDIVVSAAANNAPTVDNLIPDQAATEGTPLGFQFAANTFGDLDADTLTYTATMADDSPLISGLAFTAGTRTFNWTPNAGNVGTHSIKVVADDGNGGTVPDTFDIVVSGAANNAPTVDNLIPTQLATEGVVFSFQFNANTFGDSDGDTLIYTATMADDSALIPGLVFNAATRTFNWTPTVGNVGTHSIKVTADDNNGGTVFDMFDIVVISQSAGPSPSPFSSAYRNPWR